MVVLVTGGSSGIGKATAIALRDAGCKVYEGSRRESSINGIIHIPLDVTDEVSARSAVEQIVSDEGRLDVLVNCAGSGISGAVEFTSADEAKKQMDINFFGTVNMTKAAIASMREKGAGRVVNISSVAAAFPIPFQAYYSASKAAVESYTCCLANEVKTFGISVTCVQPGDITTGFTDARRKSAMGDDVYQGRISKSVAGMEKDEQNGMKPETAGKYIAKIARRRKVKPIYTLGMGYKCLSILCKLLPCRLRNWIVGLLYA
jgi:NAD(P)-dependent dehydrogenase (short-subunit alcohol dehydrogenase family)